MKRIHNYRYVEECSRFSNSYKRYDLEMPFYLTNKVSYLGSINLPDLHLIHCIALIMTEPTVKQICFHLVELYSLGSLSIEQHVVLKDLIHDLHIWYKSAKLVKVFTSFVLFWLFTQLFSHLGPLDNFTYGSLILQARGQRSLSSHVFLPLPKYWFSFRFQVEARFTYCYQSSVV